MLPIPIPTRRRQGRQNTQRIKHPHNGLMVGLPSQTSPQGFAVRSTRPPSVPGHDRRLLSPSHRHALPDKRKVPDGSLFSFRCGFYSLAAPPPSNLSLSSPPPDMTMVETARAAKESEVAEVWALLQVPAPELPECGRAGQGGEIGDV